MGYKLSVRNTAPATALVRAGQALNWVRGSDDDLEDIEMLIGAAMSHLDGIDGILRRALIMQEWIDVWDGFPPGNVLRLALAPASSISAIGYLDSAGSPQVLSSLAYSLHADFSGSYLRLNSAYSWPSTADRDDAVSITYIAGYGETAADVPAEIRLACKELIQLWFEPHDVSLSDVLPSATITKLRRFIRPHF